MRRFARTATVAALLLGGLLATAGPAAASTTPEDWADTESVPLIQTLLIFGGIPLGLALIIALLVMAPSTAKGPRYRPGVSWWAEPEWFVGPAGAGESPTRELTAGSTAETTTASTPGSAVEEATGGASARW